MRLKGWHDMLQDQGPTLSHLVILLCRTSIRKVTSGSILAAAAPAIVPIFQTVGSRTGKAKDAFLSINSHLLFAPY